jgi:hypothetical protein
MDTQPMITARTVWPILILAVLAAAVHTDPVHAEGCAASPVVARGEEARFVWYAKVKTRANWRRKVRSTPGLGAEYANWARAADTEERCLTGPSGTVCIFTGTPCRR